MATDAAAPPRRRGALGRVASALHRHAGLRLTLLLAAPMAWLVVAYLGSLAVLFLSAFWTVDAFTYDVLRVWNTANFHTVLTEPVYRSIALRTLGIAAAVTVIDAVVAFPMAFYTARVARPGTRKLLLVAVLTPLWASYLVKAYAWRTVFSQGGVLDWLGRPFGLAGPGYGTAAVIVVLAYLWLPYMILPIHAGLENLPASLLDASTDLGASPWRTFRSVVLPLVKPSVFAGSVFTFSLSLGDYIAVRIVGGKTQVLGTAIADNVTLDLPLAAALSCVPVALIVGYLLAVRRSGALDSL
ncbi:ABC transporter permease [Streptomyces sp. FH025]|uniref:ABC transporter permease n=1 Tax=Streptomyces sp. FH025 TaxID=2815937 RepID=UPI0027DC636C|nr:ABC transporter permease [Streptomyces sp. FH025]